MPYLKYLLLSVLSASMFIATVQLSADESANNDKPEIVLGINTADVREDTSSVQFLNLFRTAIPFSETVPWGSSKEVEYDEHGWPNKLNGGQAGTKFLNRLPEDTVEDGFFTVLYDGEGEIFYGNDARLVVHRPNKDIIEIRAGKDKILNASLFVKKSNPDNYLRNIRILPEGGVCKGRSHFRVKSPQDCAVGEYLSFEEHHLNPWATQKNEDKTDNDVEKESPTAEKKQDNEGEDENDKNADSGNKAGVVAKDDPEKKSDKETEKKSFVKSEKTKAESIDKKRQEADEEDTATVITTENKGTSLLEKALIFNPEYLNFMKDFQVLRFMNMSGMTRNPVKKWKDRNTLKKATWGGKYGSRGAPVEIMVALSNHIDAHAWFSMPYQASDDYIREFGEYVNTTLEPELKAYIEYSNEVWNPIFTHHDYAIAQGVKKRLDKKKSVAGYKWYSKRSVETFKIWEKVFGGTDRLVRVMGSWASNQTMSSTVLSYKDAFKHTDAIAIGPYFSAHPRVLRRAKTVDDVFKAMLDKKTKWGMKSTINYIKKQVKVADSYGVDLVAYEGGQHLVDWNTRKAGDHPNELLYAANRDPRMGILYDELMNEWHHAGGKLFVAFSAPRIYSWYGSWGIKEHIRQSRTEAPKYDSLLRYINSHLYPKTLPKPGVSAKEIASMSGEVADIPVAYSKSPQSIWDMTIARTINSDIEDNRKPDISAKWQANWDTKNLYLSVAVTDDDIQSGDQVDLTLDITSDEEVAARIAEQEKIDIETEKKLLEKQKKEKAARKLRYEAIAKAKKEKEEEEKKAAEEKAKQAELEAKEDKKEKTEKPDSSTKDKVVEKASDKAKDQDSINKSDQEKDSDNTTTSTLAEASKETSSAEKTDVEKKIEKEFKQALGDKTGTKEDDSKKESISDKKLKKTATKDKTRTRERTREREGSKKEPVLSSEKKTPKQKEKDQPKEAESVDNNKDKPETTTKDASANKVEKADKSDKEPKAPEEENENVRNFTFTPFDELNAQSRSITSDTGYLLNISIPWSEVYKSQLKIIPQTGTKLGVNIVVTDSDKGEKGHKELRSADTSIPLPKLVLKNALDE